MEILEFFNAYLLGALVPLGLGAVGLFFAVRLRAFPFLHPVRFFRALFQKRDRGGISPLRALSMALAGVLGVGNLVGVSAAIAAGGAGAVFWMWMSATVAMLLKYAEIVLALGHRRVRADGVRGGAMYYMEDAFQGKRAWIGRLIAGVFAALCFVNALGMGCVVQVNAMSSALHGVCGFPQWLLGAITAVVVFIAGLGGARAISSITERLVPLMTVGFAVISLVAIGQRAGEVPALLRTICTSAFAPDTATQSALGGVGGFLLSRALRFGTIRGLLSNEAGCGTSPMAHATADTDDAAAQGCLGIVEVFVDTHVLCTMTALVVLLAWDQVAALGDAPMLMTLRAYEALLGRGAGIFLAVSVLFFGLATLLCWSHYAAESCAYLVGEGEKRSALVRRGCLWLYCAFCAVGAVSAPPSVWTVADFSIGTMTLLNLVVLCRMHREVEQRSRCLTQKKSRD